MTFWTLHKFSTQTSVVSSRYLNLLFPSSNWCPFTARWQCQLCSIFPLPPPSFFFPHGTWLWLCSQSENCTSNLFALLSVSRSRFAKKSAKFNFFFSLHKSTNCVKKYEAFILLIIHRILITFYSLKNHYISPSVWVSGAKWLVLSPTSKLCSYFLSIRNSQGHTKRWKRFAKMISRGRQIY